MTFTKAHPLHEAYKAAIAHERFTSPNEQRDRAWAEAQAAWQRVAELELENARLLKMVAGLAQRFGEHLP